MKAADQKTLYQTVVGALAASLHRNFPERARQIDEANRRLADVAVGPDGTSRMAVATEPGLGATSIIREAVEDMSRAMGMRSITDALELERVDQIDPKRDIVMLADEYTMRDEACAPIGAMGAWQQRRAKAEQAAVFVDAPCFTDEHVDNGDLHRVMARVRANQVCVATVVTQNSISQVQQAMRTGGAKLKASDLLADGAPAGPILGLMLAPPSLKSRIDNQRGVGGDVESSGSGLKLG